MKPSKLCTALFLATAACAFSSVSVADQCPDGQVVDVVNFKRSTIRCVPLPVVPPPVVPPPGPLKVVDGNGEFVGLMLDQNIIARPIFNEWYAIEVEETGFSGRRGAPIFYESVDCTGAGYLGRGKVAAGFSVIPRNAHAIQSGPSTTIYAPSTPLQILASSQKFFSDAADPTCHALIPITVEASVPIILNVTTSLPWRVTQ